MGSIHYSLFIIHYSLFIIHYSLFIIHYLLFIRLSILGYHAINPKNHTVLVACMILLPLTFRHFSTCAQCTNHNTLLGHHCSIYLLPNQYLPPHHPQRPFNLFPESGMPSNRFVTSPSNNIWLVPLRFPPVSVLHWLQNLGSSSHSFDVTMHYALCIMQ